MRNALIAGICLALPTLACTTDESNANKQIVQRMVDAINARDYEALDAVIAPNVQRHSAATPEVTVLDRDAFKDFLRRDNAGAPDGRQNVEFMLAEGDLVAVYVHYSGTQEGPIGPFPATGKAFSLPFIGILRIAKGQIAEMWVEWDNLNMLSQLGLFSPPAPDSTGTSG